VSMGWKLRKYKYINEIAGKTPQQH
jgi:hypothetical protein